MVGQGDNGLTQETQAVVAAFEQSLSMMDEAVQDILTSESSIARLREEIATLKTHKQPKAPDRRPHHTAAATVPEKAPVPRPRPRPRVVSPPAVVMEPIVLATDGDLALSDDLPESQEF